jgi:hypothetical protein
LKLRSKKSTNARAFAVAARPALLAVPHLFDDI